MLTGSADYLTKHFASESVSSDPRVVAHYETNWIQLAKQNAIICSAHMAGTQGYETFGTSRKLEELYATSGFFKTLLGAFVETFPNDKRDENDNRPVLHRQGMIVNTEEKFREGYGGMVMISGRANHLRMDNTLRFRHGADLLRSFAAPFARRGEHHTKNIHSQLLRFANKKDGANPFFCTWNEFYEEKGVVSAEARGAGMRAAGARYGEIEKSEVDDWDKHYEPHEYTSAIGAKRNEFFALHGVALSGILKNIRRRVAPDKLNDAIKRVEDNYSAFDQHRKGEEREIRTANQDQTEHRTRNSQGDIPEAERIRGDLLLRDIRNAGDDDEKLEKVFLGVAESYFKVNEASLTKAFAPYLERVANDPDHPENRNFDNWSKLLLATKDPRFWEEDLAIEQDKGVNYVGMPLADALRCLLDIKRTTQLAKAIREAVNTKKEQKETLPDKDIIGMDAGTGTGILSMLQLAYGVKEVHTIEVNLQTYKAAEKILAHYGLQNSIKLTQGDAARNILEMIPPAEADILTAECFSGMGLDEMAVPIIANISKRTLRPDAVIIPSSMAISLTVGTADLEMADGKTGIATRLMGYERRCEPHPTVTVNFIPNKIMIGEKTIDLNPKRAPGSQYLPIVPFPRVTAECVLQVSAAEEDATINTLAGSTVFGLSKTHSLAADSAEFLGKSYGFTLVDEAGEPATITVPAGETREIRVSLSYTLGFPSTQIKRW